MCLCEMFSALFASPSFSGVVFGKRLGPLQRAVDTSTLASDRCCQSGTGGASFLALSLAAAFAYAADWQCVFAK